jgi:DNA-binding NarL/FixJ family response regulator
MRIGIVDDHPLFRLGLRNALAGQADVRVRWDVASAGDARHRLSETPVDVVLMDVNLGDLMDGIDATRAIVRAHPNTSVVMMSATVDDHVVFAAGKAGAAGYLAKDAQPEELVESLRALLGGSRTHLRRASGDLLQRFRKRRTSKDGGRSLHQPHQLLSGRESEVLAQIRAGRTNREIAARLGIAQTTVNKHVQKILKKLEARNRAQAASLFADVVRRALPPVEGTKEA